MFLQVIDSFGQVERPGARDGGHDVPQAFLLGALCLPMVNDCLLILTLQAVVE